MSLSDKNNSNSDMLRVVSAVIDGLKVPAYVIDFNTQKLLFLNKAFMEAYGNRYDEEQKRWNVMWPGMTEACTFCEQNKLVHADGTPTGIVNRHDFYDQNDLKWYLLTESLIEWVDGRNAILMTREDVTEQKEYERKLTERAYVDQLTGAYNQQYITDGMLKPGADVQNYGVMTLDIRSFKNINESFGHDFGDKVLVSIARALRNLMPFTPFARVSSNEFVFAFENVGLEGIQAVGEGVLSSFYEPFRVEEHEIYIDFCIGIAYADTTEPDIPALFRDADIALYYAKKGPHKMYVLTDELKNTFNSRINMEYELRLAIERYEFELYYQPKVRVCDKKVVGAEALIRWNHPERGMVSPGYFIPLAEETGLILQIGEFVIAEAARQLREWQNNGIDVFVSVNASVRQFLSVDFISTLNRWLDEYALPRDLMVVEVTESIVAGDMNRVITILDNLRQDGIRVSLDDFGTGYSSLNYLVKMPLDNLKIDKSFIDNILNDEKDKVVLETIITMAHNLGLYVTAEGVEQKEQADLLAQLDCDLIQGYYFAKPLRVEDFVKFYHENLLTAGLEAGSGQSGGQERKLHAGKGHAAKAGLRRYRRNVRGGA